MQADKMATYSYKGVQYVFVDTQKRFLEELKCPICLELVCDPVQTSCGHLFCEKCIKQSETCPIDREWFTTSRDHFNNRRLLGFKVKCSNSSKGCTKECTLGEVKEHERDCGCIGTACPNSCGSFIARQDLDHHLKEACRLRHTKCPHCSYEGTVSHIAGVHGNVCPGVPLSCPRGCKEVVARSVMCKHLSSLCPEEKIPCQFTALGCKAQVCRKNHLKHLQDSRDTHYHLAMEALVKLLQGDPPSRQPWLNMTTDCYMQPPCVLLLRKFTEWRSTKDTPYWFSRPFHSMYRGYKMCLGVNTNGHGTGTGTHVSVAIHLMKGENDANLQWPFKGRIRVTLLNQLEDNDHHTLGVWSPDNVPPEYASSRVVDGDRAQIGWGKPKFIAHEELHHVPGSNRQYLKDDNLFFRIESVEVIE